MLWTCLNAPEHVANSKEKAFFKYEYLMKVSIVNVMESSLVPCHMCGCGWKSLVHKWCYHKGPTILLLLGYHTSLAYMPQKFDHVWTPHIEVFNNGNIIGSSPLAWVGGMLTSFPGDTEFSTACWSYLGRSSFIQVMLAIQSDATFNLKTRNRCRLWVSLITGLVNGLEWWNGLWN